MVIPFLYFKGITHAYLLKMSITHDKKRIPLLNLLINCISARSASEILSAKDQCTFPFLNFFKIALYNYNLFEIFSFLSVPPEAF